MPDQKPRFPIRRFDVFAEYHRIQNEAHGMPEAQAKGRAIWAAKVVAGRRHGGASPKPASSDGSAHRERAESEHDEFRSVGGVPQTDKTFQKEIVDRMGASFYAEVFQPAIAKAFQEGKRYEDIRDAVRKDWK